jgi:hypothetical protein
LTTVHAEFCSVYGILFLLMQMQANALEKERKGHFIYNNGGSLYSSFHQKWRKLGTLLQTDALEAEMKKNFKIFDSAFSYRT